MKLIRLIVGQILLFLNFVTTPKRGKRDDENKSQIQDKLKAYALYEFNACPFCIKVRRAARRLNLDIELRDAKNNEEHKKNLHELGGSPKVPCLRYQEDGKDIWLYESSDIVNYLEKNFPLPNQ